jgi:hypothetical protein
MNVSGIREQCTGTVFKSCFLTFNRESAFGLSFNISCIASLLEKNETTTVALLCQMLVDDFITCCLIGEPSSRLIQE